MSLRDRAEALLEDVGVEGSGRLVADVKAIAEAPEVKCAPSEGAMQILKQQEVTVEDLCDLTHAMLVATGVEPIDVHKIWSKIEVLRNRKIARDAAGIGGIP